MRRIYKILVLSFVVCTVLFFSCTEPYDAASENYESLLVVEGTITDSLQKHTVLLSRTNPVNSFDRNVETNAQVWIESDDGEVFRFSEIEEGTYISNVEFAAQIGKFYSLHIITSEEKEYVSNSEETPPKLQITDVYAERAINDLGVLGVKVFADVLSTAVSPVFVKYEYIEQHKIVTLVNIPYEYELDNLIEDNVYSDGTCDTDFNIVISSRTVNSSICYSPPVKSNMIVQNSSIGFSGNLIESTEVSFIPSTEYKLRERCSLLVQAFSQNFESYQYYNNIHEMNQNESELSLQQPGFIKGNINSVNDEKERVFGYFNVWSLTEKRIFFDYTDFDFERPDYFAELIMAQLEKSKEPCPGPTYNDSILTLYRAGYQLNEIIPLAPTYTFINRLCADCRSVGSNVTPDYWEEE